MLVRKEGTRGGWELGVEWAKSSILIPDVIEAEDVESGAGDCSAGNGSIGGELMIALETQQVSKEVVRGKMPQGVR